MTLDEFAKHITRPMIIAGVRAGRYDNVLGEMLSEHYEMFDDEILAAMVAHAYIVVTTPVRVEQPNVGAQLRIRLPSDYKAPSTP
jgi:hypothetical protein